VSEQPPRISGRHQDTVRQVFAHPLSHNIEWRAVVSLLREISDVEERSDGKVEVKSDGQTFVFTRPRQKDIDANEVVELRRLLETLGFQAE
jgi:hypothetical protein